MSGAYVRKVAMLGAGVMGAQIAAYLVSADVDVVLFELPAKEGDLNANVKKAIAALGKAKPAPASVKERIDLIEPANYAEHLEKIRDCDLIIEAIAERLDWKADLYTKVAPYVNDTAIIATNTSGISIDKIAEAVPEHLRSRFCGLHFFNPVRYMKLVELIPGSATDLSLFDGLETFLTTTLGKGVIRCKDTPNFVSNRMGVFSIAATMHHTQAFGLSLDLVDALTGPAIRRPGSATYRTADIVGLDTLEHIFHNTSGALKDDPWNQYFAVPAWLEALVKKGALGQKTQSGIYAEKGKKVIDITKGEYVPSGAKPDDEVAAILKNKNPAEKFAALRASSNPQAQFVWAILRDVFHYSAYVLEKIADNARDLDFGLRWGYGWDEGPFETWQSIGWKQVAEWIKEDIAAGKTMANVPLPAWVDQIEAVHTSEGSYSPATGKFHPRSSLPVYKRQLYPEPVIGEAAPNYGETLFENAAARVWHQGDDIAILSFKGKIHAVGNDFMDAMFQAVEIAEQKFAALVIWQTNPPFCLGANLMEVAGVIQMNNFDLLGDVVTKFQQANRGLRYARVPVVAAVEGMALGGGCEIMMHCDRIVAALETYAGLVEIGVGLLPAGGGCKEMALRAYEDARGNDIQPFLANYFRNIAMATVATSAEEAKQLGFLRPSDKIVFNSREILYVAKVEAKAMAEAGYRPALPKPIKVLGYAGVGAIKMMLVNMLEGQFISEHDYLIATKIAEAVCGGNVEPGTMVTEEWLYSLEKAAFVELAKHPKTQERITHMLKTQKPLRN